MQKILTWHDTNKNITNNVYEFDSGTKLVESINPGSIESYVSIAIAAGSIHHDEVNVPKGTAHFLEHILSGNPNKVFNNAKEFNNFTEGSLSSPKLFVNAGTSWRLLELYGYSHFSGLNRLLKYLFAQTDYPLQRIPEFIEKERKIILSEHSRKEKLEKNLTVAYESFFYDVYDFVGEYSIGTEESISSITAQNLEDYFNHTISNQNLIISIQNPKKLTKVQLKLIENFTRKLNTGKKIQFKPKEIKNSFKYKIFNKENSNGIFFSINRFIPTSTTIDYTRSVLDFFFRRLITELIFKKLREERGLTYSSEANIDVSHLEVKNYSVNSTVTVKNFKEYLDALYDLLNVEIEKYLLSEESDSWLLSEKSLYLYRLNQTYSPRYAAGIAIDLLTGFEVSYDFSNTIPIAKDLTKQMLLDYYKKIIKLEPGFWIVTSEKEEDIENVFKESKFYKAHN